MSKEKEKKEKLVFNKRTRRILTVLLWLGCFSPVLAIIFLIYTQPEEDLPSVEMLENPPELLASIIYADDGKSELGRYWSVNRTTVNYKEISPYVFDALIATEDERFMEHSGVDFRALGRAVTNMGSAGGASTISQQLAKLLFTLQQRERDALLRLEGKEVPSRGSGKMGRLDEKIKENIIAVRLEERYTKEEIITMYLNQFDFLYNAVGIENAAKVYFNKKAIDLNKNEAAILVGMCKNPSQINPYSYQIRHYENPKAREQDSTVAIRRRNTVLSQWLKNSNEENPALRNYITQAEYDSLKQLPIITDYQRVDHKEGLAPYFRESLRAELSELFKEKDKDGNLKYAKKNGEPYNIYKDGLRIYTTINVSMQEYAEEAVRKHLREDLQPQFDKNNASVKDYPFANYGKDISEESKKNSMRRDRKASQRYDALKKQGLTEAQINKNFDTPVQMTLFSWKGDIDTLLSPNDSIRYCKALLQAGLMSMDPNTGFVKAWVGGIDFKYFAYDHVRSTRQVGSTIKPFVYSTALAMGVVKPCTKFEPGTSYCVDTYGENGNLNKRWCPRGDIPKNATVANGLAISSNPITVAVMSKMGGYSGPKTISKLLKDLNINLRPEDEVPSMCLGVMDLSLFQMVGAQSMFVNQGIFIEPTTILRIEDRSGNVIYSAEPYSKEVMNAGIAYTTLEMMKGVVQMGTGASLRSTRKWGGISHPTAGKTGTTQNNADGWFMGLTPELVTGVWVGADDRKVRFRSMTWGQGARMALPIYGYYMQQVYKDRSLKISTDDFEMPAGYDPELYGCDSDGRNDGNPIDF